MPKRSTEFQKLVFLLQTALGDAYRVEESAIVKDKNGTDREIDILIRSTVGTHEVTVAIECSEKNRPEDLQWVNLLVKKHHDLRTDKLILVSKNGLTKSGKKAASADGVEVLLYTDVSIAALDLSGYGETEKEAIESFRLALEEFVRYTMAKKSLYKELERLGWKVRGKEQRIAHPPSFESLQEKNLISSAHHAAGTFKSAPNSRPRG